MNWEAYFNAALEELELHRETVEPSRRDFLHAKIADAILMALAQCEPGNLEDRAGALNCLTQQCRAKAREAS